MSKKDRHQPGASSGQAFSATVLAVDVAAGAVALSGSGFPVAEGGEPWKFRILETADSPLEVTGEEVRHGQVWYRLRGGPLPAVGEEVVGWGRPGGRSPARETSGAGTAARAVSAQDPATAA